VCVRTEQLLIAFHEAEWRYFGAKSPHELRFEDDILHYYSILVVRPTQQTKDTRLSGTTPSGREREGEGEREASFFDWLRRPYRERANAFWGIYTTCVVCCCMEVIHMCKKVDAHRGRQVERVGLAE